MKKFNKKFLIEFCLMLGIPLAVYVLTKSFSSHEFAKKAYDISMFAGFTGFIVVTLRDIDNFTDQLLRYVTYIFYGLTVMLMLATGGFYYGIVMAISFILIRKLKSWSDKEYPP